MRKLVRRPEVPVCSGIVFTHPTPRQSAEPSATAGSAVVSSTRLIDLTRRRCQRKPTVAYPYFVEEAGVRALATSLKIDLPFEPIEIFRGFDSRRLHVSEVAQTAGCDARYAHEQGRAARGFYSESSSSTRTSELSESGPPGAGLIAIRSSSASWS